MTFNLSALGRALTSPFRGVRRRVSGSRSRYRRLTQSERKLRTVKLVRLAAILGFIGVIAGVILFFALFAWFSRDLPKPGEIVRRQGFSTRIVDRNGEYLYDLYADERRIPVNFDDIPEHLKQATIAIEDKDFYRHQGFDVMTLVRIPYNLIVNRRVVGGSTLTQQLVKNVFLTSDRSLIGGPIRKFKEIVLSIQIERTFSKDQILEMYLNENPYGGNAWGVGTAAEMYFGKPVQDLTLAESAILAGLPQRPSAYSPYAGRTTEDGTPLWKFRALGVLRRMREDGYISELIYEQTKGDLDNVEFQRNVSNIRAPHFVFYLREKLEEMYGPDMAERGGLRVYTTIDLPLQMEAEKIVAEEIEKVISLNITNGAAVIMDPNTGEILSMVGSRDYFSEEIDGQFNVAVNGLRQPGSSIKPLTYLALLQRGYTPASLLMDVETTFQTGTDATEEPYRPRNYDGQFRGPVSVRQSLGNSLNIPAVKSMALVGVENFLSLAYEMGFDTLEPTRANLARFGLALTLGGGEVHLIDTVTAYSAFANGGYRIEPVAILKIEDKDGRTIYEHRNVRGRQVIQPEEAFLINDILSDNSARSAAFGANSQLNVNRNVAVKTGTTNEQKDNWTIGWSREIMVGVWVGNNDNTSMTRVASGITGASPIWRRIIDFALTHGYSAPAWERPAGIEEVEVDAISGYPSHDGWPSRQEFVIRGTLPSLPDPIHTKLKLCRGQNRLATDAQVAAGDYDEKEFFVFREDDPVSQDGTNRWQEAINAWIGGQGDERYKPPGEYCGEQGDVFVRLHRPENERTYNEQDIEIDVEADSGEGIEKIEIWVNGAVRETINDRRYKGKINLPSGRYEIYAKARSRDGKEAESNKVRIGTGGQDWKEPAPSPSPTPSPTPTSLPVINP